MNPVVKTPRVWGTEPMQIALNVELQRVPYHFFVWLLVLSLPPCISAAASAGSSSQSIFPFNASACQTSASDRAGAGAICDAFASFVGGALAVTPATCASHPGLQASEAVRCLSESRCLAAYDVATCIGRGGFNYSGQQHLVNVSICLMLVSQENSTLHGTLQYPPGKGCDHLLETINPDDSSLIHGQEAYIDPWLAENSDPSMPPLPHYHPCRGMLEGDAVARVVAFRRRAGEYTTHDVLHLNPAIGPIGGGSSIAVCGLGFTMANEAVGHLACKFTDGLNELVTAAVYVNEYQLRCETPDFSRFAVGLPHNVSVEVSTNRGSTWTENNVQFTYYSSRPAVSAHGRPMWGYESTFSKASWQVAYTSNYYGSVQPFYQPTGHASDAGRPSQWDSHSTQYLAADFLAAIINIQVTRLTCCPASNDCTGDPFHTTGDSAAWSPVQLDTSGQLELAEDVDERASYAQHQGVHGSWGDRKSFLRAHHLVPDTYRKDVIMATQHLRQEIQATNNGLI